MSKKKEIKLLVENLNPEKSYLQNQSLSLEKGQIRKRVLSTVEVISLKSKIRTLRENEKKDSQRDSFAFASESFQTDAKLIFNAKIEGKSYEEGNKRNESLRHISISEKVNSKDQQNRLHSSRKSQSLIKNKDKHPLIRSFIIKDENSQANKQLIVNCVNEHEKFSSLLQECLNKKSLNSSKAESKHKRISQSFNNFLVKESLQNIPTNENGTRNSQVLSTVKTHHYNRVLKNQCKNIHGVSSQRETTKSNKKNGRDISNESSITPGIANRKDSFFNNELSTKGNYNGYLKHLKQRKKKEIEKAQANSIKAKSQNEANFLNVKMLDLLKSNNESQIGERMDKSRKQSLAISHHKESEIYKSQLEAGESHHRLLKRSFTNTEQPNELDQQEYSFEISQIVRKVSMKTPSPEKSISYFSPKRVINKKAPIEETKEAEESMIKNFILNPPSDDDEDNNESYLKTVNF